ncbi:hypothetical protein D3C80_2071290 [compost metagenome]
MLVEMLRIVREQGRGYVLVEQSQEGQAFNTLWQLMTGAPVNPSGYADRQFVWVKMISFDGGEASAKWVGKVAEENCLRGTQ